MADRSVTKICGVFALLSSFAGLAVILVCLSIDYPPFVNFGNGETLLRFASIWPKPLWCALLQVAAPSFALCTGLGFYQLLKKAGSYVALGAILFSLGAVFSTAQDGIEVTVVDYLPRAYAAADASARPALLALGDIGGTAMNVFGRLGIVSFFGLLLINLAIQSLGGRWKLISAMGLSAVVLILIASTLPAISEQLALAQAGFPIGFMLLRIWMIVMGLVMIQWKPDAA